MWETVADVLTYLGIVLVGFLIWAALSPFELLGWWAGWFGEKIYDGGVAGGDEAQAVDYDPSGYLVFISGVGKANGEVLGYREAEFLRRLSVQLPETVIISDLFPYSVNNLPLTGQPFFARLWRWALRRKLNGQMIAGYLINVRNIWQLMISADKRYGPMYNQAVAEIVVNGLLRYGYDPEQRRPIYMMGYSGAGQLAVGAVQFLKEWLRAPVYLIVMGGVFASNPSLEVADHVYYLYGQKDSVHRWGLLAPGRWPMTVASEWNRARRKGKVTMIDMGPMDHNGRGGYLDHKSTFPDGTYFIDYTVATIRDIVQRHAMVRLNRAEVVPQSTNLPDNLPDNGALSDLALEEG